MALPSPEELRKKREQSTGLPNPNTIVPSLIKQREEGERLVNQARSAPDLFNPMQMQSNVRETFSQPKPSTPQATSLPDPGQILKQQYERFQPQPEFEPVQASPLAKLLGADKKPLIGPSLTNIAEMVTKDPILRGVSRGAAFGLGDNVMPQRTGSVPIVEKVGEFAGMLFPGAAAERAAASVLRPVVSNLPRIGQFAARGAAAGALHGGATEAAQEFGGLNNQTIPQRLGDIGLEAAFGGALGAVADIPRLLGNKARNAAEGVVGRNLESLNALETVNKEANILNQATSKLDDLDEQIASLNTRTDKGAGFNDELTALNNERESTIQFIRQLDPEFKAPEPVSVAPVVEPVIQQPTKLPTPQAVSTPTKRPKVGERAFNVTLRDSPNIKQPIRQGLESSPNRTYKPITNEQTLATANKRIERQGIDQAEAQLLGKKKFNADDVATGMRLIQQLQSSGNVERAVSIADKVATELTKAGQTVQAASIWNRLSPEGALLAAKRKVNRINENLLAGQSPVSITPEQAQNITEAAQTVQAAGVSTKRAGDVMTIMDKLKAGDKITPDEKQLVSEFIEDAKRFVKPKRTPKTEVDKEVPPIMRDKRTRDKVVSFMDKQEQAALDRIRARRNRLSSTPFDEWGDYVIVLASRLTKGSVKGADLLESMVRDFGEEIRPHFDTLLDKAKSMRNQTAKRISKDDLESAQSIVNKISTNMSESQQKKAVLDELTTAVKETISKIKTGDIEISELDKIKRLSKELTEMTKESKPIPAEKKYQQQIQSLAKKLSGVEKEVPEGTTELSEIRRLLQGVSDIVNEGVPQAEKNQIDKDSIDKLAYQLYDRAKPSPAEKVTKSFLKKHEDAISDEDANLIRELAQKVSKLSGSEQRVASQDLQAIMQGFEKAGIGRKIQAAQYIAMLLNPLTQIRNIVGNELLYRFERLQRVLATPIDIVASKVTGGPRTVTFKRGPSVWENYFQPTQDFWGSLGEGMSAGWRGVSPEGLQSKYELQGQAFRSKYNPMTYLEKSLGAVLQGFDYAAYTRAANQRLSEMAYLDALNKGVKGDDAIRQHMQTVMTNLDDEIHTIAKDYGKFVTLQNDSLLANKLMGLRRGANQLTAGNPDFGAGSTIIPFAKTPANLLLRGLDYSPAGALKGLYQAVRVLRGDVNLTRADVIENVSRSIFGSGIGILAYWLTDKGAMFGKSNNDPEVRKLMQGAGVKDFQINGSALKRMVEAVISRGDIAEAAKLQPGDTLWGYEWAQPSSIPAAVGSTVYQGTKDGKGGFMAGVDGALAGLTTLYDSSVLSSLNEIFKIPPNETNTVKALVMNLLKQVPSQFVPSFARQLNTLSDEKVRETYASKSDVLGQFTNYAESTLPGLAQRLPQRVDTLGRPQTRLNTFLDVFVSPAARSLYKPTPEAQLVIDLINETGDNSVAPRAVAKYLTGTDDKTGESKRIDLTPQQYVELQTLVGQETANRLKKVNPNWSTEKKVEFIVKELTEAGKIGRNKLKRDLGLKVSK